MRALLLLALIGRASADIGGGLATQATRYDGRPNRNVGAAIELSLDRGSMQYLAEAAVLGVSFGDDFGDGLAGTMYRGGLGVRWLARHFTVLERVDFDLGFEAIVAMQAIEWSRGGRDVRPELDAGFTWNIVYFRTVTFRTSLRAFFTPSPSSPLACRGACPAHDTITSGFMVVTGLVW